MTDTDSAPLEGSAGEGVSVPEASPEPEAQDLDSVLNAAVEEHYQPEEPEGPVRDEHGRFTSTKTEEQPDEAPPAEASKEGDDQESEDETEPEGSPLEAPQHWSAEDRERFAAMPKNAQEWALERDKAMTADYTRKTQEIAETRNRYQQIDQTLEPVRAALQANGITEAGYIQRLMEADRRLQTDPVRTIKWLAQNAGVDLATLEPGEGSETDPQIAALRNQVQQLSEHLTTRERAEAEARQQETISTIENFQTATDEAGNPQYPHFEALRSTMGALIKAGHAAGLEDAYNKAIRLDDTLYQQQLEAERTKAKQAEEKLRSDAVAKAKPLARSSTPLPNGTVKATDLDGLLSDAINQAL